MNELQNSYLIHYGVKGMQWGVRHDPRLIGRRFRSHLDNRRLARRERYRQKLMSKSAKKVDKYSRLASNYREDYRDLSKNGLDSSTWQKEVDRRVSRGASKNLKEGLGKGVSGALSAETNRYNKKELEYHKIDVKFKVKHNEKVAKDWLNNNSNLMKMKIDSTTSKKDIRKAYKGNMLNRIEKLNDYDIPKDRKKRNARIATTVGSAIGVTAGVIGSKYVTGYLNKKLPIDLENNKLASGFVTSGTIIAGQQLGRYGGKYVGKFLSR